MEPDDKKNESESESKEYLDRESWKIISALRDNRFDDLKRIVKAQGELVSILRIEVPEQVNRLEDRIKALEEHLMSLDHGSDGNHPNDGGWFQWDALERAVMYA